jgi:hypothetical protein
VVPHGHGYPLQVLQWKLLTEHLGWLHRGYSLYMSPEIAGNLVTPNFSELLLFKSNNQFLSTNAEPKDCFFLLCKHSQTLFRFQNWNRAHVLLHANLTLTILF